MSYSDKVIDHYSNPKNVGTLDKSKLNVGTGLVGAPECGDVMRLQIEVENNIIIDAKFKTFGCGSAIASSSISFAVKFKDSILSKSFTSIVGSKAIKASLFKQ